MSADAVARLLQDETGEALLSSQRIHAMIEEEARRLSAANATQAKAVLATGRALPPMNQEVAMYDAPTEEVVVFDDGIQVKKQKAHREKPSSPPEAVQEQQGGRKPVAEKVHTDVRMLQRAQGGFTYMREGTEADGDHVRAAALVKSAVIREDGERTEALNRVAITDGARRIRLLCERVFGLLIVLI
jgi:hypothetical protein